MGLVGNAARRAQIASYLKRWISTVESADMTKELGEEAKVSIVEAERTSERCHEDGRMKGAAMIEQRITRENTTIETC